MINQRLNEAVARKFGYNGPADSEAVDKFLMSKPESINTVRRALNIMKPTTGMAEGGDTETTATTTADPDTVTAKTPELLAKEEQDRIDTQNKAIGEKSFTAAADPTSLATKTTVSKVDTADTGQKVDPTTGQIATTAPTVDATKAATTTADASTTDLTTNLATTTSAEDATRESVKDVAAVTTEVKDEALVDAVTKDPTKNSTVSITNKNDCSRYR